MTKILTVNELNVYVHRVVEILAPDHKRGRIRQEILKGLYMVKETILCRFSRARGHTHILPIEQS